MFKQYLLKLPPFPNRNALSDKEVVGPFTHPISIAWKNRQFFFCYTTKKYSKNKTLMFVHSTFKVSSAHEQLDADLNVFAKK